MSIIKVGHALNSHFFYKEEGIKMMKSVNKILLHKNKY